MSCFLSNSSLGKKLIMSVTGCFPCSFILFHMSMNVTAIISPEGYNAISVDSSGPTGMPWPAPVILAAGVLIHFIYAIILTPETTRPAARSDMPLPSRNPVGLGFENMLVLGFIVLAGLLLHLFNFWSKMQLVEIMGQHTNSSGTAPQTERLIRYTFSQWYYAVIYLAWFAALWFHPSPTAYGRCSRAGWANDTWYPLG